VSDKQENTEEHVNTKDVILYFRCDADVGWLHFTGAWSIRGGLLMMGGYSIPSRATSMIIKLGL
jgi:hypothetical protein